MAKIKFNPVQMDITGAPWWEPVERLGGKHKGFTLWRSALGHYEVTLDQGGGEPVEPKGIRGLSTRAAVINRLDFELKFEG